MNRPENQTTRKEPDTLMLSHSDEKPLVSIIIPALNDLLHQSFEIRVDEKVQRQF